MDNKKEDPYKAAIKRRIKSGISSSGSIKEDPEVEQFSIKRKMGY